MRFADIPGNEPLKARLAYDVQQDRLPHALLFLGAGGSANLAFALALIQFVNCQNRSETDSCGACLSCRQLQKLAHPDLFATFPILSGQTSGEQMGAWRQAVLDNPFLSEYDWIQKLTAENKTGNIPKSECVELIKFTGLKTNSPYKVALVWRAEHLSREGNILLKTIEEPPEKTLILLVASDADALLTTIRSRVQLLPVRPVEEAELAEFLVACRSVDRPRAQRIASLSEGNLGRAIELAAADFSNDNAERLAVYLRLCYKADYPAIFKWIEDMTKTGREAQKHFLSYVSQLLQAALRQRTTGQASALLSEQEQQMMGVLLDGMTFANVETLSEAIEARYRSVERNANPKLLFVNLAFLFADYFAAAKVKRSEQKAAAR